jgi:hypothetical protein
MVSKIILYPAFICPGMSFLVWYIPANSGSTRQRPFGTLILHLSTGWWQPGFVAIPQLIKNAGK